MFAVVNAWYDAGCPQTNESRHSFRYTVRILDWITQNIFNAGPLLDGHEEVAARVQDTGLTMFRELCVAVQRTGKLNHGMTATEVAGIAQQCNVKIPKASRNTDVEAVARIIGIRRKQVFEDRDQLSVDDFDIRVYQIPVYLAKRQEYQQTWMYEFTQSSKEDTDQECIDMTLPLAPEYADTAE